MTYDLPSPEFHTFVEVCEKSPLFKKKIEEFKLPPGFEVVIEPWPYGGLDAADENRRFFQGLIFAADASKKNMDTNFYPYPLPIIPVMDWAKKEIIRIDELATGGKDDPLEGKTYESGVLDHCSSSEYVPELLEGGLRKDLKALNVTQPDGPSFSVTDNELIEWQKWRFRVTFNPREGAVIHDVHYDGRSVVYRLAFSEMVSRSHLSVSNWTVNVTRPYHTRTHERPSTANKPSTSVTAASATAPTIFNSAAIA